MGGTRFYQRREVKDALAYLRVLRSDYDAAAYERIINVPDARHRREDDCPGTRGGSSAWRQRLGFPGRSCLRTPSSATRTRSAVAAFVAVIESLRRRVGILALPELLDAVLEESGYRAMLLDGSQDGEDRWANLLELREVVSRYADLEPDDAVDRLLEETALVADQDSYEKDSDAVTLITLHAAKGLEFDIVFITGLEEGVFPHSRSLDDRAPDGGGAAARIRRADAGTASAVPDPRLDARDLGTRRLLRAFAVPAGDPGRTDARAAPGGAATMSTTTSDRPTSATATATT